jgi:hypothetical protein
MLRCSNVAVLSISVRLRGNSGAGDREAADEF